MTEVLQCSDCGQDFTFTDGERTFYESKSLTPPKRCKGCRAIKKQNRAAQEAMGGVDREVDTQQDTRNRRRDGKPGRW